MLNNLLLCLSHHSKFNRSFDDSEFFSSNSMFMIDLVWLRAYSIEYFQRFNELLFVVINRKFFNTLMALLLYCFWAKFSMNVYDVNQMKWTKIDIKIIKENNKSALSWSLFIWSSWRWCCCWTIYFSLLINSYASNKFRLLVKILDSIKQLGR